MFEKYGSFDFIFSTIIFSLSIFFVGIVGLFGMRTNAVVVLICIELMLLAATYNFGFFSFYLDDIYGHIFSMLILTVAAAESAIGLALIVIHYRHKAVISIDSISYLKG
jgi:NADH-quinone oxidoreductase subunit K